jgi:hypothetical protein
MRPAMRIDEPTLALPARGMGWFLPSTAYSPIVSAPLCGWSRVSWPGFPLGRKVSGATW